MAVQHLHVDSDVTPTSLMSISDDYIFPSVESATRSLSYKIKKIQYFTIIQEEFIKKYFFIVYILIKTV